jgi:hypothetical protein
MKIDDLLENTWKDFLSKNLKWITGVFIRFGPLAMIALLVLFTALTRIQMNCGSNNEGPIFVIKQGKTINVTKIGKDNSTEQIKEIDAVLKELEELRKK